MVHPRSKFAALAAGGAFSLMGIAASAAPPAPKGLAAVVADPTRPAADVARDADRKPAEVLAFAGVRPGMQIAELAPGGGYFTHLLSGAVGSSGHVYAVTSRPSPSLQELVQHNPNVTIVSGAPGTIPVPGKVDLVWTTQNYHDFKNNKLPSGDVALAYDAEAFRVLKPGGIYFISDHETARGAGASQTSTLHRIEDTVVRREVQAAGFKLEATSNLLRHPADDHTGNVESGPIRGKTDQFMLKFRKPR
jgi:predicted methyltransferase